MSIFQTTLYLSNLPKTIQPTHLSQILSRLPPVKNEHDHDQRPRLRDPGICMIQIYTVPLSGSPSISRSRVSDRTKESRPETHTLIRNRVNPRLLLRRMINQLLCLSSVDDNSTMDRSSPRPSMDESKPQPLPQPANPGETGTGTNAGGGNVSTPTREIHIQEEEEEFLQQEGLDEEEEKEKTIAYIHFKTEAHLYRAQKMLGSVIIDGRPVKVTRKRLNAGLVKRVFTKTKK